MDASFAVEVQSNVREARAPKRARPAPLGRVKDRQTARAGNFSGGRVADPSEKSYRVFKAKDSSTGPGVRIHLLRHELSH
jgi:hypothetical protein